MEAALFRDVALGIMRGCRRAADDGRSTQARCRVSGLAPIGWPKRVAYANANHV
jgi:hypothetical protein